jgi:WS/DGAT/MGAT family acyltransferase
MDSLLELVRLSAMADFDRARPLWEATLIEGLAGGRAALLCKLHHALTDGVGAIEMAKILFDDTEHCEIRALPEEPESVPDVSTIRDVASYSAGLAGRAAATALTATPAMVAGAVRHPRRALADAYSTATSILRTGRPLSRPGSPILRERSKMRRLGTHRVPTKLLHRAGEVAGGSMNDAFIAAVTGGLRLYHEKHGVEVGDLTVMMPISIRTSTDTMGGNRATLMRFSVPGAEVEPAERIRIIHEMTTAARNEKSLGHTPLLAGALNLAPRWYVGSVLRNVDFIASDVPGFPQPVFLGGASVTAQYAFPPTLGAALNVTLLSYAEMCSLGMNVDSGAVPDAEAIFACIVAGFDEVLALGVRGA